MEGVSIKHDVSVPIERIPEFLVQGIAAVAAGSLGMVLVTVLILQSEAVARICVYAAGIVILGIFDCGSMRSGSSIQRR